MTFGRYDTIAVVEAPSDEAMGKSLLTIGSWGRKHGDFEGGSRSRGI